MGACPNAESPNEVARRLAGSIVITKTLRPARAAANANAADDVVLPTPPGPTHSKIERVVTASRRKVVTSGGYHGAWAWGSMPPMKKELTALIGGAEVQVIVELLSGSICRVTVGDRSYDVDAVMVRPGMWSLRLGDRSFVVDLEPRRGGTLAVSGLVHALIDVQDTRQRRLAAATGGGRGTAQGEVITAPIAGKVVKLHCAVGDVIAPGAGVIVLEAMKMENEIASERGGTVKAIAVVAGQSVETGERLLELA